jgi:hypothetical protein
MGELGLPVVHTWVKLTGMDSEYDNRIAKVLSYDHPFVNVELLGGGRLQLKVPESCLRRIPLQWLKEAKSMMPHCLMTYFKAPGRVDLPHPTLRNFEDFGLPPTAQQVEDWWGQDIWTHMAFAMLEFTKCGRGCGVIAFRNNSWHRGLVWSNCDKKNQNLDVNDAMPDSWYMWWPGMFVIDESHGVVYFWCQDFAKAPYSKPWPTASSRVWTLGKLAYFAPAEDDVVPEEEWEERTLASLALRRAWLAAKVAKAHKEKDCGANDDDGDGHDDAASTATGSSTAALSSLSVATSAWSSQSSTSATSTVTSSSSFAVVGTATNCTWPTMSEISCIPELDELDDC